MGMGGKIYKKGGKFPDLNKDGKITMADIYLWEEALEMSNDDD